MSRRHVSVVLPGLSALLALFFFFLYDTATTEIYTLSLHDALPISANGGELPRAPRSRRHPPRIRRRGGRRAVLRSEEHTSELQSLRHLVCRLLLEKKKKKKTRTQKVHKRKLPQ